MFYLFILNYKKKLIQFTPYKFGDFHFNLPYKSKFRYKKCLNFVILVR